VILDESLVKSAKIFQRMKNVLGTILWIGITILMHWRVLCSHMHYPGIASGLRCSYLLDLSAMELTNFISRKLVPRTRKKQLLHIKHLQNWGYVLLNFERVYFIGLVVVEEISPS